MINKAVTAVIPPSTVATYPPDEAAVTWVPGDFLLTHRTALFSRFIRSCQKLRIHGDDAMFTYWSHAALIVSDQGELIEALKQGVCRTNASAYRDVIYKVVHVTASPEDRAQAVAFAHWSADRHEQFGHITLWSIFLSLITGGRLSFYVDGTEICSALVARCQERTGAIFDRQPSHIMPADLAKYYQVQPPKSGAKTGTD